MSITVNEPIVQGGAFISDHTADINDYSHIISASGGYISANFTLMCNQVTAENWLQYGLGRHIIVHSPSLDIVWEGFVNEFTINFGAITYQRGPLTNVGNRVSATYTELIEYPDGTVEPVSGVTSETIIVNDETGQAKFGIWEKVLNIGEAFPADAEYIRDLYLVENSYPEGNPTINVSSKSENISIRITCRGYIDWLSYVYNDDAENQYVYCSELIKTILGADPNSIFSTYYDRIDENLVLHATYINENKTAKTIIDDILTLGGGSDDRWTFGVYSNRKVVYSAIPLDIEYVYHKTDREQQIETLANEVIQPWAVRPCKWVAIPSFLSSFDYKMGGLRNDPRVFFAEEVNFTAPDQVTISGAKIRRLDQYMAKLGLRGA